MRDKARKSNAVMPHAPNGSGGSHPRARAPSGAGSDGPPRGERRPYLSGKLRDGVLPGSVSGRRQPAFRSPKSARQQVHATPSSPDPPARRETTAGMAPASALAPRAGGGSLG